jgi:hypothetical protein
METKSAYHEIAQLPETLLEANREADAGVRQY